MITKAVIAVAGYGTRRLPITRSIEKCMLPIGNRPVVDYVVQACIENGVTDIAFVVNSDSSQLREYYQDNLKLEAFMKSKHARATSLHWREHQKELRFRYIVQPESYGYGTSCRSRLHTSSLVRQNAICIYRVMTSCGYLRKNV